MPRIHFEQDELFNVQQLNRVVLPHWPQKLLAFSQQSKWVNIWLVAINFQGPWIETYEDMISAPRNGWEVMCHNKMVIKHRGVQGDENPTELYPDR